MPVLGARFCGYVPIVICDSNQRDSTQKLYKRESLLGCNSPQMSNRACIFWNEHPVSLNISRCQPIDLALDSYPYNGTTTTCEALWMGVPTISLSGSQIQSRIGASLLTQVGLEHFCVASHSQYIALAQQLYKSPDKLARLRSRLRARVQASSLIDPRKIVDSLQKMLIHKVSSDRET